MVAGAVVVPVLVFSLTRSELFPSINEGGRGRGLLVQVEAAGSVADSVEGVVIADIMDGPGVVLDVVAEMSVVNMVSVLKEVEVVSVVTVEVGEAVMTLVTAEILLAKEGESVIMSVRLMEADSAMVMGNGELITALVAEAAVVLDSGLKSCSCSQGWVDTESMQEVAAVFWLVPFFIDRFTAIGRI